MFRRASFSLPGGRHSGSFSRRPSLQQRLHFLLDGKYQEAAEGWPRLGREDHLAFVKSLYRRCDLPVGCDPRWWCEELECDYQTVPGLEEVDGEAYDGHGAASYSPAGGPRRWGPLLYHAVVHHANETLYAGELHHADVWLCTFELASPAWWLADLTPDEAFERHPYLPLWWLELYAEAIRPKMNWWQGRY